MHTTTNESAPDKRARLRELRIPLDDHDRVKHLLMCAAIWRACYPEDRGHFETVWRSEGERAVLLDVANYGCYSFQVEGILSRYVTSFCSPIRLDLLGVEARSPFPFTHAVLGSAFARPDVSPSDWEDLRLRLYQLFDRGFYGHDLTFADKAINALMLGRPCKQASCNHITDTDSSWTATYAAAFRARTDVDRYAAP